MKVVESEIKEIIEKVLAQSGFSLDSVILFGSQARRNFTEDSDYDILVVIKESIAVEQKKKLWEKIFMALHKDLPFIPFDLIIKSQSNYEEEKEIVNTISNEAYFEGKNIKIEYILKWFKKAESDIRVAKHMLKVEDPPTDVISFHCQPAIEKYLKAFLTFHNVRAKKTHDIKSLLDLCLQVDKDLQHLDIEKISKLTFFAVEIRYPDDFYFPTVDETKEYFRMAIEVKNFIVEKLNIKQSEIEGGERA